MSNRDASEYDRYDVLVLDPKTRSIEEVVGSGLFLSDGYYSARAWRNTWRIRQSHSGKLIEIGTHKDRKIGSTFSKKETIE